jgi:hypothetical protein
MRQNEYMQDKILLVNSEGKRELGRSSCSWGIRLTLVLNWECDWIQLTLILGVQATVETREIRVLLCPS